MVVCVCMSQKPANTYTHTHTLSRIRIGIFVVGFFGAAAYVILFCSLTEITATSASETANNRAVGFYNVTKLWHFNTEIRVCFFFLFRFFFYILFDEHMSRFLDFLLFALGLCLANFTNSEVVKYL